MQSFLNDESKILYMKLKNTNDFIHELLSKTIEQEIKYNNHLKKIVVFFDEMPYQEKHISDVHETFIIFKIISDQLIKNITTSIDIIRNNTKNDNLIQKLSCERYNLISDFFLNYKRHYLLHQTVDMDCDAISKNYHRVDRSFWRTLKSKNLHNYFSEPRVRSMKYEKLVESLNKASLELSTWRATDLRHGFKVLG